MPGHKDQHILYEGTELDGRGSHSGRSSFPPSHDTAPSLRTSSWRDAAPLPSWLVQDSSKSKRTSDIPVIAGHGGSEDIGTMQHKLDKASRELAELRRKVKNLHGELQRAFILKIMLVERFIYRIFLVSLSGSVFTEYFPAVVSHCPQRANCFACLRSMLACRCRAHHSADCSCMI